LHKIKFLLLLILILTITFIAVSEPVINSGHSNPIQYFSSNGKVLYSCDNVGTLIVWDTYTQFLLKKLQVSHLQVKDISVNAEGTRLAVVETDTISSFKLSVWDLEAEIKLFSHKMDELPLFVEFSPKGSYVVYSKADWNSLIFLDAEKGYEVPLLFEDYGIVSSIFITSSEKTLMFYSPSGTIQYWNLSTGKLKTAPIRTRKDLSSINMSEDGLFMTASDNTNLYLINLQTGSTLFSERKSDLISSSSNFRTKNLIILKRTGNLHSFEIWNIATSQGRGSLNKVKTIDIPYSINPTTGFEVVNNSIYFSDTSEKIILTNINTEKSQIFSENIMASISDVSILNGELLLATEKKIISISSDVFKNKSELFSRSDLQLKAYDNPFMEKTGIVTNYGDFYIYPMETKNGELQKLHSGQFTPFTTSFTSPIISADFINGDFITLEKDGSVQIINSYTGKSDFRYSSFGINSIEYVYGDNLIAGRNRTAFLQSPLLHINPISEEVVTIEESNIIIFKMDYDSISRTLYTLGFEEHKAGLITVLKSHNGKSWEITNPIITYPGEDHTGTFVVDETKSRIYLSIGNSGLLAYGWNGFTSMENTKHTPKKLFIFNDFLISINTDSTLTFWDTNTGKILFNFYLLQTNSWIATVSEDKTIYSENSLKYLIR
jgi:hypothetical protein